MNSIFIQGWANSDKTTKMLHKNSWEIQFKEQKKDIIQSVYIWGLHSNYSCVDVWMSDVGVALVDVGSVMTHYTALYNPNILFIWKFKYF